MIFSHLLKSKTTYTQNCTKFTIFYRRRRFFFCFFLKFAISNFMENSISVCPSIHLQKQNKKKIVKVQIKFKFSF